MPSIDDLEKLLRKDPEDVFLNYGLAMALASAGRMPEALSRLDRVLNLDENYVPAYFQKGRVLANEGEEEAAKTVLRRGVQIAATQGDTHAAEELRELLDALEH